MRVIRLVFLFFLIFPSATMGQDIIWDQGTLRKVSSSEEKGYSGYARMIVLKSGAWFCVYEAAGNIVRTESRDAGNSWSKPTRIASKEGGVNNCVPDLLQLADGSLLVMYNARPSKDNIGQHFAIKLKRSHDEGVSWEEEQVLYEAGTAFKNGCWEPAAIQLPNGVLQLFFANEGVYPKSDEQNISMLESFDKGLTWTKEPKIVSFRAKSRDGMPVPLLLKDQKEIVVAIEDNGFENFKPAIIRGMLEDNWNHPVLAHSKDREFALKQSLDDTIYAGAPYLRQLKSGETILSYQGTEGRKNDMRFAEMKVVIGDSLARYFDHKSVPFQIPEDRCALWSSLMVTADDTMVALTSTNAYSDGKMEVWMVKGRLKRNE